VWRIGTLQVLANHQVRPFVWVAKVSIEFMFGAGPALAPRLDRRHRPMIQLTSRIAPFVCQSQDVVVSACVNVLEIPALSYRPRLGLYNRCSSARRAPRNTSSPRLGVFVALDHLGVESFWFLDSIGKLTCFGSYRLLRNQFQPPHKHGTMHTGLAGPDLLHAIFDFLP